MQLCEADLREVNGLCEVWTCDGLFLCKRFSESVYSRAVVQVLRDTPDV